MGRCVSSTRPSADGARARTCAATHNNWNGHHSTFVLSTSCSLLLVLLFSQAQHTGRINLKGGKVEKGDFTLMAVQYFSLQFVGGMIRPSLLSEPQTILKHS